MPRTTLVIFQRIQEVDIFQTTLCQSNWKGHGKTRNCTHTMSTKEKNSHCYLGDLESILRLCALSSFYCICVSAFSKSLVYNKFVYLKQWTVCTKTPVTFHFVPTELQCRWTKNRYSEFVFNRSDTPWCLQLFSSQEGRGATDTPTVWIWERTKPKATGVIFRFWWGTFVKVDNHVRFYILYIIFVDRMGLNHVFWRQSVSFNTPPQTHSSGYARV